jgi:transcriptional regulator with GAF, ATPase, and Fis domain
VEISVTPLLLGRDERCSIVLADEQVSAAHCEISAEPQGVLVRDLGSLNGTYVGPVRVAESAYLTAACTITLGSSRVVFEPTGKEDVEIDSQDRFGDLVGASPAMRLLFRQLREVAPTDLSVLITGETGTGKERVAQAIHEHSARAGKPFVVVDCTTIVGTLAESQLFGHEKGAFSGATARTDGYFQQADGGTLFLDEIGELPVELQPKLLRALAEQRVQRLGGRDYQKIDVRVIAATLQDLGRYVNHERFRSDLFFRLKQVPLKLPPLRDRRGDIPAIVRAVCGRIGRPERAAEIIERVTGTHSQYRWPGNVRELVQAAVAAAQLPAGSEVWRDVLFLGEEREIAGPATEFAKAKREAVEAFERAYFAELHEATKGNVSEMARRSGMQRHHVKRYLRKLGLRGDER